MIRLTRLNGGVMHLNADLVAMVEAHHDTVITMTDGKTCVVQETADQVVDEIITYRATVIARAAVASTTVHELDDEERTPARVVRLRSADRERGLLAMELATPIGIFIALIAIAGSFAMEGGSPMVAFSNPAAVIIICGATLGVGMASNKMSDIGGGFKATLKMLLPGKKLDGAGAVNELMQYADIARRDGLLALEEKAKSVEDPFLKRGLELVIDGTDSSEVAEVLEADIAAMKDRHKIAAKFYADCGSYAPAIGIVGCVLGLTIALSHMDNPTEMGHSIASAFIATLWGIGSANVFHIPMSNKMKRASAAEVQYRQMIVEGVLAIQAGVSPRAVGEKLKSHLAPKLRATVGEKKAA